MPVSYDQRLADYNKAAAELAELIDARDLLLKKMKQAPARRGADEKAMLQEVNEIIESSEQALAREYQALQDLIEAEADFKQKIDDGWRTTVKVYLHIKHNQPEMLEKFTKAVLDKMDFDIREEFLDLAAIMEAKGQIPPKEPEREA